MSFSETIARLNVALGMDTASFAAGADRNERRMSRFSSTMERASGGVGKAIAGIGAAFAGLLAADVIGSAISRGLEYASALGEQATQLGVTTKALQEYRYAASQAGIEEGEMDKALATLTRRLGEAAGGAKAPNEALKTLGVNLKDANGHIIDAGDAIPLIADGLQKLKTPAERAAVVVDLFGKSGMKLLPLLEGGAKGVNSLRDAAQKLGLVLTKEQIDKADEAADKMAALKQVLEAKIAGAVADNADSIIALTDAIVGLVDALGKAFTAWRKWQGEMNKAHELKIRGLTDQGYRKTSSGPLGLWNVYEKEPEPVAKTRPRKASDPKSGSGGSIFGDGPWFNLRPAPAKANAIGAFGGEDWARFVPGIGSKEWMKVSAAANDIAEASGIFAERIKLADTGLGNLAGNAANMLSSFKASTVAAKDLAAAAESIITRLFPEQAEKRQLDEELAVLNRYFDTLKVKGADALAIEMKRLAAVTALNREYLGLDRDRIALAPGDDAPAIEVVDGTKTIEETNREIIAGFEDAMTALQDQSKVTAVKVVQTMGEMVGGILGAIDQLNSELGGGKFLSMLSGILKIGLTLGSSGLLGKGFQSFLNSVPSSSGFVAGEHDQVWKAIAGGGRIPGFAQGTSFAPGGLAMVGEYGPELVDLPRGARVTPNNEIGGRLATKVEIVDTTGLFVLRVNGQIQAAAPRIATAGAAKAIAHITDYNNRRLA